MFQIGWWTFVTTVEEKDAILLLGTKQVRRHQIVRGNEVNSFERGKGNFRLAKESIWKPITIDRHFGRYQ